MASSTFVAAGGLPTDGESSRMPRSPVRVSGRSEPEWGYQAPEPPGRIRQRRLQVVSISVVSPSSILRYLAALAPAQQESAEATLDVVARPGDFVWLGDVGLHAWGNEQPPPDLFDRSRARRVAESTVKVTMDLLVGMSEGGGLYRYALAPPIRAEGLARLSAIDWLDPHSQSLLVGWLWLCGHRRDAKGTSQPVMLPAISRVVRLHEAPGDGKFQPEWRSDPEIHPFLAEAMDAVDQDRLLEGYLRYDTAPVLAGCRTLGMTQLPEVV